MGYHPWNARLVKGALNMFHVLLIATVSHLYQQTGKFKRRNLTFSSNSVINRVVPSRTPTVASSSRCKFFVMPGSFTRTGESKAGVTRPSARASEAAHSFLNQSTATLMAFSVLAYSSRAASLVIGCLEAGIKAAVDLTLFLEA